MSDHTRREPKSSWLNFCKMRTLIPSDYGTPCVVTSIAAEPAPIVSSGLVQNCSNRTGKGRKPPPDSNCPTTLRWPSPPPAPLYGDFCVLAGGTTKPHLTAQPRHSTTPKFCKS